MSVKDSWKQVGDDFVEVGKTISNSEVGKDVAKLGKDIGESVSKTVKAGVRAATEWAKEDKTAAPNAKPEDDKKQQEDEAPKKYTIEYD